MEKGKFIVIEGGDGSGKSTHSRLLAEHLTQKGVDVVRTCEPTEHEIGKLIRRYLKGELQAPETTIAALFLADRIEHITSAGGIIDLLNQGKTVICDRYYLSSMAYNCMSESIDWVFNLNMKARALLKPDLIIYLKTDLSEFERRLSKRNIIEIYETTEYQRKVLARYEEAMQRLPDDNIKVVETVSEKAKVAENVAKIVDDYFIIK